MRSHKVHIEFRVEGLIFLGDIEVIVGLLTKGGYIGLRAQAGV